MKRLFAFIVALLLAAPVWAQAPNLLGDVQAERAKYPAQMNPSQVAAMLNAVAWTHRSEGFGLLRKGAGNSCPIAGTYISCDILIHAPSIHHFDVLQDSENSARPQWNDVGLCILSDSSGCAMDHFLPPTDPGGTGIPPVIPPVIPPGVSPPGPVLTDLSGVYLRFDDLRSRSESLYAQMERVYADLVAHDGQRQAQIAGLDAHLTQMDNEPSWLRRVFTNPIILGALAGAGGLFSAQRVAK